LRFVSHHDDLHLVELQALNEGISQGQRPRSVSRRLAPRTMQRVVRNLFSDLMALLGSAPQNPIENVCIL